MTTRTCPCGTPLIPKTNLARDRNRKYCSRSCSGTYGGGKPPAAIHCRKCGWLKDAENTYANGSCRRCTLAAWNNDPDYVPAPRGTRPSHNRRPPKRTPKPAPPTAPVVSEPSRPPWRPPGWSATPNTRIPGKREAA